MIRSILVALDGSEPARVAGRNAAVAAQWFGARLRAVFVDDSAERARMAALPITPGTPVGGVPPSILVSLEDLEEEVARRREQVAEFLRNLCQGMGLEGVALETVRGRPADCIVRLGHQVDLLVMGRSGFSAGPEEDTLGSVCEAVLHHANKPVLVSTAGQSEEAKRPERSETQLSGPIVVAYDGRHPANKALAVACQFAEQARAGPKAERLSLIVLCIKDVEQEARPLLEEARQYLLPHGVEAEFLWQKGPVAKAIVAKVKEAGGGMVAMGAFGESRLREVLLGSHTRRVLLACTCPVLLAR